MADEVVVAIGALAAGGAGVGRHEGMAVFVPRTAPGDLARVRLRRRKRYAEGQLLEVLRPGPGRVAPPCAHYTVDACGGCQLQHLAYAEQLDAKQDMVRQALVRIARRDVVVAPVRAAPSAWGYRNKLTLTLRQDATGWTGGLRAHDNPDLVFALDSCALVAEPINRAWHQVRAAAELLPRASELRVVFRAGPAGTTVIVKGGASWPRRGAFEAACPAIQHVRHDPEIGADSTDADQADGSAVRDIDAFEQVNPAVAAEMFAQVLDRCRATSPTSVVDAFGGRGDLARRLAADGARVTLIELDAEATRIALAVPHPKLRVITARVEDELAAALPADLVVLNPPRTGVDAAVCEALELCAQKPQRVIYVSCDPATLARDLARLPGYRLDEVAPFDMFPQTAHVETVCVLSPEAS